MAIIKILLLKPSFLNFHRLSLFAMVPPRSFHKEAFFNSCLSQHPEHNNSSSSKWIFSYSIHSTHWILTFVSHVSVTLCPLHSLDSYTTKTCFQWECLFLHITRPYKQIIIIHIYQPRDQQALLKNSYCYFNRFVHIPLSQEAKPLALLFCLSI